VQGRERIDDRLNRWFERHSTRGQRAVYIEDALIGDRFLRYVTYRLRFFAARFAAGSFVHALRFVFLYTMFHQSQFYALVAIYSAAGFIESFWWGALEVMRAQVRDLYQSGNPRRIAVCVAQWLSLSGGLAAAVGFCGMAWVVARVIVEHRQVTAADFYAAVILIGVAAALVTRCYHSGIYAIRRIYRPFTVVIALELGGFVLTLVLWPLLGAWSLPTAMMLSTLGSTAAVVHYTYRAYSFLGLHPWRYVRPIPRIRLRGMRSEFAGAGLANAVVDVDSFLVLGLAVAPHGVGSPLFVMFFAASPTVRAGVGWAKLFYFDLKRLDVELLGSIRRRFERRLRELAVVLGIASWLIICAVTAIVSRGDLRALYIPLLPFCVARSLLAKVQIAAFSRRAYAEVVAGGGLLVAALIAVRVQALDGGASLLVLTGGAVAAMVFTALAGRLSVCRRWRARDKTMSFSTWLAALAAGQRPVRLGVARFGDPFRTVVESGIREEPRSTERRKVAEALARRLGRSGAVTSIFPDSIVWYERGVKPSVVDDTWLVMRSVGTIRSIERAGPHADGAAAAKALLARGLLGHNEGVEPRYKPATSVDEVTQVFGQLFPSGGTYDSDDRKARGIIGKMPAKAKRAVLGEALRFSREFRRSPTGSRFEVTTLCTRGGIKCIFVVDRRVDPATRSAWHRFIRQANLASALGEVHG
jgi:hypothetical protein